MKRSIVGWFLVVFIMGHTQMVQVLRLPFLCVHYWEHRSEGDPLTLAAYLHNHYAHDNDADNDAADDARLPFKTLPPSWQAQQDFVADIPGLVLPKDTTDGGAEFSLACASNVYSPYLAAIWQPPQA